MLAEGQHLARIASTDDDQQYNKLLTVLRFLRENYQNSSGEALKEATVNYLDVDPPVRDQVILLCAMKRTAGAVSTKRKKSGVEIVVTSGKKKTSCDVCRALGHNKATCPIAAKC